MCDSFVYRAGAQSWFAKNSDREPDEPQFVEFYPAHTGPTHQVATYISVEVPKSRNGILLSRPSWMWGAEIGVNEAGVAIGNEAVYTKLIDRKHASLLGMDLVRLALEQATTAEQACEVIVYYLEKYGQGGPAGFRDKKFRYDNAFLVSDANAAYVIDTAGRFWARKKIVSYAAISNDLSISTDYDKISGDAESFARKMGWWTLDTHFNFKQAFRTRFMPWMAKASERASCSLNYLARVDNERRSGHPPTEKSLFELLRSHQHEHPSSNGDVCMHAKGILRPSATTNSWVVELSDRGSSGLPEVWSSFGQPCQNDYKKVDWHQAKIK